MTMCEFKERYSRDLRLSKIQFLNNHAPDYSALVSVQFKLVPVNDGLSNIGRDGVEAAGANNVDTFGLMKRV